MIVLSDISRHCPLLICIALLQSRLLCTFAVAANNITTCFRIEVFLEQLKNPKGVHYNGSPCDWLTACDPMVYAYVDLENVDVPALGSMQEQDFDKYFVRQAENANSFHINSVVKREICKEDIALGDEYRAKLRIRVRDYDYMSRAEPVDDFDCAFRFHLHAPLAASNNEGGRSWSESNICYGLNQPKNITVSYRWKVMVL